MKFLFYLLPFCTVFSYSQTYVPDDNFEQALIDLGYDDVLDDYVVTANISNVTSLNVSLKNIADLTGIQDFTSLLSLNCQANNLSDLTLIQSLALEELKCGSNELSTLDLSNNLALKNIECSYNLLSSLDVSNNINLEQCECGGNPQLVSLDFSNNPQLRYLYFSVGSVESLNIDNNPLLEILHCTHNQLSSLDVTNNPSLTELLCAVNNLTELDLANNPLLQTLFIYVNQLTTLDLSNNTSLFAIEGQYNQLTSLDLSNNPIVALYIDHNNLEYIDLRNGVNNYVQEALVSDNPNLTCIYVDDVDAINEQVWTLDDHTAFVETEQACEALGVQSFGREDLVLYPNPCASGFKISGVGQIDDVELYNLGGKLVRRYDAGDFYDVEGIAPGFYVVKLVGKDFTRNHKLVIE